MSSELVRADDATTVAQGATIEPQRIATGPSRAAMQATIESYSGPIPHPEILAKYNELLPGSADRILKEFEQQSAHRRGIEKDVVKSEIRNTYLERASEFLGQILAFLAMMAVLGAGLYVATLEGAAAKVGGSVLGATSLAGIVVKAFIQGRDKPNATAGKPQPKKRKP